jgi:hypothetical protein
MYLRRIAELDVGAAILLPAGVLILYAVWKGVAG